MTPMSKKSALKLVPPTFKFTCAIVMKKVKYLAMAGKCNMKALKIKTLIGKLEATWWLVMIMKRHKDPSIYYVRTEGRGKAKKQMWLGK